MNAPTEKMSLSKDIDMTHFWMPFTANKQFKAAPRMIKSAKGIYFTTVDGQNVRLLA
jgi:beta-alanine--pyruvate transaminase